MRIIVIGALVFLTLCILIGVMIYDRKVKIKKHTILHALWRLASKKAKDVVGREVAIVTVVKECPNLASEEFKVAMTSLTREGFINKNNDNISFTFWGATDYVNKIKSETIRG